MAFLRSYSDAKKMWTLSAMSGKPVDRYEPAVKPVGGLLFLHDRDGIALRDRAEVVAWLDSHKLAVACPYGGECWWTDRIWPGFDERLSAERWLIENLLPELKSSWRGLPIAVAGIGMGGQGALRIAFKHPNTFPIVAALDAAIDCYDLYHEGTVLDELYPSREHCRQDSPVLHASQEKQPPHIFFACRSTSRWEGGNDRLHEKLGALGVAHQYAPGDKEVAISSLLDFVERAIVEESRRLL